MSGVTVAHTEARRPSLLVVTTMPGTISAFLLPYIERLRELGWRVGAATGHEAHGDQLHTAVEEVWRVGWGRRISDPRVVLRAVRDVRRILSREQFDIVHTHTPIASAITRAAVATLPVARRPAVVYTAHGFHFGPAVDERGSHRVFALLERIAGRWTDRLVVINGEDFATADHRKIVPAARLVYMPGIGVDPSHHAPSVELDDAAAKVRSELGLDDDTPLLTMVAHFDARKNHDVALRALAEMARRDAHLAFAGKGRMEETARRLAGELGVCDRVHFLGIVRDVRPLVRASIATVLPSRQEGLSRAVLESLMLGVPVVGSNIRGIAELVRDGGGILVATGDHTELARGLDAMLHDPRRHFDADTVRARLRPYAIEPLVQAHLDLYQGLLWQYRCKRKDPR